MSPKGEIYALVKPCHPMLTASTAYNTPRTKAIITCQCKAIFFMASMLGIFFYSNTCLSIE